MACRKPRRGCWLAASLLLPSLSVPAQPPADGATAALLDPVVVTAPGNAGASRDLPMSASVIDADVLQRAGPQINLSEALSRVPGISANNRSNYAQDLQISSRGFGTRASFGVRGIRLYTDGIPAATPDGQGQVSHFNLASAERIEVIRGPYSSLYGNGSGGVISLVTRDPQETVLHASADIGSFNLRQYGVGAEGRLGESFSGLAEYSTLDIDGFRPQSQGERDASFVRLGYSRGADRVLLTASDFEQSAQDPLGLTQAQFDADTRSTAPQATQFNTRKDLQQTQGGLSWRRQLTHPLLQDFSLTAYAGHREVTQWQAIPVATQGNPRHPGGVIDFGRDYQGADARLRGRLGPATLTAGVSVDRQQEDRRGFENFVGSGGTQQLGVTGALRRDEDNDVRGFDQYLQADWPFLPRWVATAGVRHGELRFESDDRFLANGDDSGRRDFSFTTPVAGLSWRATEQFTLYASAGRGYESPTLNELAYRADGSSGFNDQLRAQTSRQFELGLKSRSEHAQIDAAVFLADTDDELVVQSNSGGRSTFGNAAGTRRYGAELSAYWVPTSRWELLAALSWLDASYSDDFLVCAAAPCTTPNLLIPEGNRLPGTAGRQAFLEAGWSATPQIELGAEWRLVSHVAANDTNSVFADGHATVALRAQHVANVGSWRLRTLLRLDNLLDREYAGSVIVNESNGRYYEPGAPRSVMLSLRIEQRPR